MGECLSEYGCAWCDARSINPARNPQCMSLFETSACPLQTTPHLTPRLPEEPFPSAATRRCEGSLELLRDPCISARVQGGAAPPAGASPARTTRARAWSAPVAGRTGTGASARLWARPERAEAAAGGDPRSTTRKCQNGGECTDRGDCSCPETHTGTMCQTLKTRVDACHAHGDWDADLDDCVCDEGYVGVGDNRCAFPCDPAATCGGRGYCSELDGACVCDTIAAGVNCECVATPLTTPVRADPVKNQYEKELGRRRVRQRPCRPPRATPGSACWRRRTRTNVRCFMRTTPRW